MDASKMQFVGTGEGIGMGETAVLKVTTDACDACEGVHDDESLAYGPAALHALADGLFARGWMDASAAAFEDDREAIVRLARGIGWNEDSIEPFETAALGDMQAFIRESFVAGMPHAVLPIESLYTMRGYDGETSAKNLRTYLNEPARHMSVVLSDLAMPRPQLGSLPIIFPGSPGIARAFSGFVRLRESIDACPSRLENHARPARPSQTPRFRSSRLTWRLRSQRRACLRKALQNTAAAGEAVGKELLGEGSTHAIQRDAPEVPRRYGCDCGIRCDGSLVDRGVARGRG